MCFGGRLVGLVHLLSWFLGCLRFQLSLRLGLLVDRWRVLQVGRALERVHLFLCFCRVRTNSPDGI